jgi:hypothetical protein
VDEIVIRTSMPTGAHASDNLEADLEDLAAVLGRNGYLARVIKEVDIPALELGRGFVPRVQHILIFIGSEATGALLNAVITDVLNSAKTWARERLKKNRMGDPEWRTKQRIIIYGPDGKLVLGWEIDSAGEHESHFNGPGFSEPWRRVAAENEEAPGS